MTEDIYDIAIIGGGILGAATFYKLQKRNPNLKIIVIEKEDHFAAHQTGNNSGVVHSGIYYKPGSLKAINCVKGRHELIEFAKENHVKHDICGKVIVATSKDELSNMERIYQNGIQNKIEGLEKINGEQIKEHEPFVEAIAGLWVPCTGIIDFRDATEKMIAHGLTINENSKTVLGEEVVEIEKGTEFNKIIGKTTQFKARHLVFCTGLQADRMAKKDGVKVKEKVVPFRGDYYELTEQAKHKVKNLIYPVPNPDFPFLGVHFTRMVDGSVECGPNAVFSFKREGYKKTDFSFKDTMDALAYKGTWSLFMGNVSYGIKEYRRAFSKKMFLETLQRMIPSLTMDDIHAGRAGVRAQLLGRDGDTRDDFRIEYLENSIHVLNAPSPAATASLAIGEQIAEMAEKHFVLK